MGKYINRPLNGVPESVSSPLSPSGEFPVLYPALYEFLTLSKWEDGTTRRLGSLSLFVDDSLWKCCLNDKDGPRVAFVSGSSVEEVLQAAEDGIVQSLLVWRSSTPYKNRGKRI